MTEFLTEPLCSIAPGFTFGIADIDYVSFTSDYASQPQRLIFRFSVAITNSMTKSRLSNKPFTIVSKPHMTHIRQKLFIICSYSPGKSPTR